MSNSESKLTNQDLEHLQTLAPLQELQKLAKDFTFMEVFGIERRELSHSNLLAFLLNPRERHGLKDRFLKAFLKLAVAKLEPKHFDGGENGPSCAFQVPVPPQIDDWKLGRTVVKREWKNIDIYLECLLSEEGGGRRLAVIVENKIFSKEEEGGGNEPITQTPPVVADDTGGVSDELSPEGQLEKYWKIVDTKMGSTQENRPYRIGIFLTPESDSPKRLYNQKRYAPVGYREVVTILQEILQQQKVDPPLPVSTELLIGNYIETLERHVLKSSTVTRKCAEVVAAAGPGGTTDVLSILQELERLRLGVSQSSDDSHLISGWKKFYDEYFPALDLIAEHQKIRSPAILGFFEARIGNTCGKSEEASLGLCSGNSESYFSFLPACWEKLPEGMEYPFLLFEFESRHGSLKLRLKLIGPKTPSPKVQDIRERVLAVVRTWGVTKKGEPKPGPPKPPFTVLPRTELGEKFTILYDRHFWGKGDPITGDFDGPREHFHQQWQEFLQELPVILKTLHPAIYPGEPLCPVPETTG